MPYSFPMNLLHIATGKNGGARLAAEQLVLIQKAYGNNVTLIPGSEFTDISNSVYRKKYLQSKTSTMIQKILTKPGFGLFSTVSISKIANYELDMKKLDIIHIHNWFNQINIKDIKTLSKRYYLVFTLHDERLATGGCHYTFNCSKYLQGCKTCPGVRTGKIFVEKNKKNLDQIFSEIKNYGVITPSNWILAKHNSQSVIQNAKTVVTIPNITDFGKQLNIDTRKSEERNRYEIIFVASDINQPVKGLNLLINSLNSIARNYPEIHLNIVGKGILNTKIDFSHKFHGFLDKDSLNKLLKKSNFCVVPSLMDNLPSVIIEAMRNECIVLASNVGGISELICDGKTGFLTDPNQMRIQEKIIKIFNLSSSIQDVIRKTALSFIVERYDNDKIYEKHLNVYKEIQSNGN